MVEIAKPNSHRGDHRFDIMRLELVYSISQKVCDEASPT